MSRNDRLGAQSVDAAAQSALRRSGRGSHLSPNLERSVLSAFALACAVACVYAMRRADPDLWGYLAYGRLFVEHGGPLSRDPFAYTSSGYHWVSFEYLAQILIWEAYHLGGPLGLMTLKCLIGGLAVYFLFLGIRATSEDPIVWVPVFAFATSTLSRYFLFRPQLFTFAFFALYVAALLSFLLGHRKVLWFLPIVMLAWTNLHGGFLAGLGLLCLAVALRICQNANSPRRGRGLLADTGGLLATLVASVLATFINPQGWRLWSYVLTEIFHSTNRRYIDEWRPTLQAGDHWTSVSLVLLTAGIALVGWLGQRRLSLVSGLRPWQWVLSCLPLMLMAYWSVRHVPLAAIWIAPVVALLAANIRSQPVTGQSFRGCWSFVAAVACVPPVLTIAVVCARPWPRIDVSSDTLGSKHPCTAVSFMRRNHLSGNVYNPLWWGSYITWQLYPGVLVSMDGRNISAFPGSMVVENLKFYSDDTSSVDVEAPLRYRTDFLLVPSDRPVLRRVLSDSRWRKIFADQESTLFARTDRKPQSTGLPVVGRRPETPGSSCSDFLE